MERHNERQKRVPKRAKISFNNGFCVVQCVIRNMTEEGAFLDFSDALVVPEKFRLYNGFDGFDVNCAIVRRLGNSADVKFVGPRKNYCPKRVQVIGTARSGG